MRHDTAWQCNRRVSGRWLTQLDSAAVISSFNQNRAAEQLFRLFVATVRSRAPLLNLSSDIRQKEFLCRKRPEFPPDVTGSVRGIKADFPICIKKLFSDIHFPYFWNAIPSLFEIKLAPLRFHVAYHVPYTWIDFRDRRCWREIHANRTNLSYLKASRAIAIVRSRAKPRCAASERERFRINSREIFLRNWPATVLADVFIP